MKTRWEGMDCYNYQPMIYAYQQEISPSPAKVLSTVALQMKTGGR
ncbi:hypothetical protein [Duncaniella dubosii]